MEPGSSTTEAFVDRLRLIDGETIERVAAELRADLETVDGEIAWWRATIAVSGALRRDGRTRQVGLAAHLAAAAVVAAAERAGIAGERRSEVIAVARAAAEVARVLVARDVHQVPGAVSEPLLHPWLPLVA